MRNKIDRATAVIWSNRGKQERDRGSFDRALACFDKAVEFDPDYALAHSNKAQALLDLWRVEEAGESASRALSLDPRSASASINRGLSRLYQGFFADALKDFEMAIDSRSEGADGWYNAGLALTCQGRLGEAVLKLESAVRLNTQYCAAFHWLGMVHLLAGNPLRAVEMFDRVLALEPTNESARGFRETAKGIGETGGPIEAIEIRMGRVAVTLRLGQPESMAWAGADDAGGQPLIARSDSVDESNRAR